jgi:purine-nucleoside phosphorylase
VKTTLVLSAWEPEIAPLRRMARAAIAAGALVLEPVGVGAVDAAAGAARAIDRHRPARVIFVGTAGAYARGRRTLAIGAVVLGTPLVCVSTAAVRGDGYLPTPMAVRQDADAALTRALAAGAGIVAHPVACPLAITRAPGLARAIATDSGALAENLEAFAVARAAAAAGLPIAAVLGVANRVGPRAHREWLANHVAASTAACRVVASSSRRMVKKDTGS